MSRNFDEIGDPIVLGDEELGRFEWDEEADLVIAGFGGAGVSAAIEGIEAGLDVLAIDRFQGGGATAISGGVVYLGGGTETQRKVGVEDSADNLFRYLSAEVGDAVEEETLRKFCDENVEMHDWLIRHGVPFEASLCPFKTSYPSNWYYLYESGNESIPPFCEIATPAARGHRAHGRGVSGAALFGPLRRSVFEKGIRFRCQTIALRLIMDESDRVIGLECLRLSKPLPSFLHRSLARLLKSLSYVTVYFPKLVSHFHDLISWIETSYGERRFFRAHRGVLLAAGGFCYNLDMIRHYAPGLRGGSPLGTIGDDGSGIQLGVSAGGAVSRMDRISKWRFLNPPAAFVKGILVDENGQRICNEMSYGDRIGTEIFEKDRNGKAWLVIDHRIWKEVHSQLGPGRVMWFHVAMALLFLYLERKKDRSLKSLASRCGIEPVSFEETVADYNRTISEGGDDSMGKPREALQLVMEPPFYALNVSYDSKIVPCPSLTLGGLVVDERSGGVKREDGSVIEGLYAAGRSAVGLSSNGYVSGLSLVDCLFSGRRAAKHLSHREITDFPPDVS